MKCVSRLVSVFIGGVVLCAGACVSERPAEPQEICAAESQGVDSTALGRELHRLSGQTRLLQSLVVARNGCVILEAYRPPYIRDTTHYLNSATKAVLSALVGIAVHDGRLGQDARVLPYLARDAATDDDSRRGAIAIRDLLTMSSGISWHQSPPDNTSDEMGRSTDWVRFILARPWDHDPQGRSIGSAALQMRPIDMLKIGLLYLGRGMFDARRVLDATWVTDSLTRHGWMPAKGGAVAYGYYWWLYPERDVAEAWGGAGQRIAMMRDLNIVVVMTGNDPADYPRSPLAASVYDAIRASARPSRRLPTNSLASAELRRVAAELLRD